MHSNVELSLYINFLLKKLAIAPHGGKQGFKAMPSWIKI